MSAATSNTTLSQLGFGNLLRQSWEIVKKNYGSLFMLVLFSFALLFSLNLIVGALFQVDGSYESVPSQIALVVNLISSILQAFISMGWIYVMIKVARGETVKISDLFARKNRIFHYFLASLLYGLVVFAGFILLIVPGIIWSLKYSQMMYLIIDKDMGVMDAFKASSQMTKGSKGTMMLYGLGFLGINLLGLLPLGLGLFVTLPIAWVANGAIYLHLSKRLTK